eukprot:750137-Hanusia_phi.AAC.3
MGNEKEKARPSAKKVPQKKSEMGRTNQLREKSDSEDFNSEDEQSSDQPSEMENDSHSSSSEGSGDSDEHDKESSDSSEDEAEKARSCRRMEKLIQSFTETHPERCSSFISSFVGDGVNTEDQASERSSSRSYKQETSVKVRGTNGITAISSSPIDKLDRFRVVVPVKQRKSCDPRFESTSGHFNAELALKQKIGKTKNEDMKNQVQLTNVGIPTRNDLSPGPAGGRIERIATFTTKGGCNECKRIDIERKAEGEEAGRTRRSSQGKEGEYFVLWWQH